MAPRTIHTVSWAAFRDGPDTKARSYSVKGSQDAGPFLQSLISEYTQRQQQGSDEDLPALPSGLKSLPPAQGSAQSRRPVNT